jgi:DNA polymerase III gamma/tau subunit
MALPNEDRKQWDILAAKPHEAQSIWFLNAFWNEGVKAHAEQVWEFHQKFAKLSKDSHAPEGACDLDEFFSHKFLEEMGETMTVMELRKKLAEIDLDKNTRMCISEYLLFKYSKSVKALVNAPQGDEEQLRRAQALVEAATAALDEVMRQLEAQKAVVAQAAADEKLAKENEEKAKVAEKQAQVDKEAAAAAVEEQKKAREELEAQQRAYDQRIADLVKKSEEGGVVSRNRAKAELEQARAEDPLPLRKAKLNQDAAVRKSEKAHRTAEESAVAATQRREAAVESTKKAAASRAAAEEGERQLEIAVADAEKKRDEALEYLQRVKNSGAGAGQAWWLTRGLYEKQQYLPKAKQTMKYPNPGE